MPGPRATPPPFAFPPYCLNVHRVDNLAALRRALRRHIPAVRAALGLPLNAAHPFPVGLHLSHTAAEELLASPRRLRSLQAWLRDQHCIVAGLNAFPAGPFHAPSVKTSAYLPDWRSPARLEHTIRCARLLAALLPEGAASNLTTVPGGWAPDWHGARDSATALRNLHRAATECRRLRETTGRDIRIAVEPEPGCIWSLNDPALADAPPEIGWCLDVCHAAVDFLPAARFPWSRILRIQLSAALECRNTPAARAALAPFAEPVYLHQTRAAIDGHPIAAWPDLAPALADAPRLPERALLRVHFHVPLTWPGNGPLRPTAAFWTPAFFKHAATKPCEVETYTYSVLPRALRADGIDASIAAEIRWAATRLAPFAPPQKP